MLFGKAARGAAVLHQCSLLPCRTEALGNLTKCYLTLVTQEVVKLLEKDQAVSFVREHNNPHDANAIKVETLDGVQIGYVPKGYTDAFASETNFGRVLSVGKTASGDQYGASVGVVPEAPSLTVDVLPSELEAYEDPSTYLKPGLWQSLQQEALQRCSQCCEVSGVVTERLLTVPLWRFLYDKATVQLIGALAVCEPVWRAKQMHKLTDVQQAGQVMQAVNDWNERERQAYVQYALVFRPQVMNNIKGWKVDTSLVER